LVEEIIFNLEGRQNYIRRLKELEFLFNIGEKGSNKILEEFPEFKERRRAEGTFLFSKILLHILSILRILPQSSFSKGSSREIWDVSSVAVLSRAVIESYLSFYYLSVDDIPDTERKLRFEVWDYYCDKIIVNSIKVINPNSPKLSEIRIRFTGLWESFENQLNKFVINNSRTEKEVADKMRRIKKGKTFLILDKYKILARAGIGEGYLKVTYSYLSQFTHSTSFASNTMRFKPSDHELMIIFRMIVEHNINFAAYAIRDFFTLFPQLNIIADEKYHKIFREAKLKVESLEENKRTDIL